MSYYQRSQYANILTAIVNLAQSVHDGETSLTGQLPYVGPGRNAVKKWEVPSLNELSAGGGTPFLAVRFGRMAGYGLGGVMQSADIAAQGPGATEPYWDWEVFSLHPYDEQNPDYSDAAADLALFLATFNDPLNHTLGGVAQSCYVADATPAYVELTDGSPYAAAYLVVRTGEFLVPT